MGFIIGVSLVSALLLVAYIVKYARLERESKKIMKAFEVGKIDIFRENYIEVKSDI